MANLGTKGSSFEPIELGKAVISAHENGVEASPYDPPPYYNDTNNLAHSLDNSGPDLGVMPIALPYFPPGIIGLRGLYIYVDGIWVPV
jgi:hypothetical protein